MLVFSIINAPSKTIKKNTVNNNRNHMDISFGKITEK